MICTAGGLPGQTFEGCVFLKMEGKITALKAQKRNPNRISVYLDGEYAFGLARIVAAWLQIGQQMTTEQVAKLRAQDTVEVAYQKALHFLSYRPRSEAEVQQRLIKQGYTELDIETVLQRLREHGFVQDTDFARQWIENRSTFRPRSHRVLAMELRQKGVGEETIQDALTDAKDDEELAYQAALHRLQRYENLDWEVFREKLGGFLLRRGFTYGTVSPVVRRLWQELQSGHERQNNEGD